MPNIGVLAKGRTQNSVPRLPKNKLSIQKVNVVSMKDLKSRMPATLSRPKLTEPSPPPKISVN